MSGIVWIGLGALIFSLVAAGVGEILLRRMDRRKARGSVHPAE